MDSSAEILRPIASLLSKSEKAQTKLAAGSWQYKMLESNIKALRIAYALLGGESGEGEFSREDLREALDALASMIGRTEGARAKFAEGTSQHTLQRNRLNALRSVETLIKRELEDKGNV
jgi:hypothetical protein